jgi:hypothetical protein
MAKKLIDQEEAARILGVTTDELNSMRDRKQVFPKRDAGVWKYELDQIQRLADERKDGGEESWDDAIELGDLSFDTDTDAIVLGDDIVETEGPSTVVGKNKGDKGAAEHSESDVRLVSDSGLLAEPPSSKSGLLDDIVHEPEKNDELFGSGSLKLSDEDLQLASASSKSNKQKLDRAPKPEAADVLDDDDEFVLESKSDSDITIGGGDSGISLVDPNDSGLSLEQPLELEDSAADSFDLGEEDIVSLDEDFAVDESKSDDDFLLTPIDDASEEPDSSSQVIALDAEEDFGVGSSPAMLEADDITTDSPLGAPSLAPALAGGPAVEPIGYEAPYSGWNITFLVIVFLFMFVGTMLMYDLVRHMWSWGTPFPWNGGLIDALAQYLP